MADEQGLAEIARSCPTPVEPPAMTRQGAVDLDGDPVPVGYYCNSRLTFNGEVFGCGLHLDLFRRRHDGRHQGVTAPPCGGCGGREMHRPNCPTPDTATNAAVWVWWTDEGHVEFEGESDG